MKIRPILISLSSLIIVLLMTNICFSQSISNATSHNIIIKEEDNLLKITETIDLLDDSDEKYESIYFWIDSNKQDIMFYVNSQEFEEYNSINDNLYELNISSLNISKNENLEIQINYNLPISTEQYEKTVQYDTDSFKITYKDTQIYSATNIRQGAFLSITLTEEKTEILSEPADTSLYLYIIIILIILIIVLLLFRKKSSKKTVTHKTDSKTYSEELLNTKKTLLMQILKEIEKKHRAKQISDETYNKLKDRFKSEAVESMKQLDDIKSKIK